MILRLSKNDGDPARRGMLGERDPFSTDPCLERSVCESESDDELLWLECDERLDDLRESSLE